MEILCNKCNNSLDIVNIAGKIECPNCLNEINFDLSDKESEVLLKDELNFTELNEIKLPGSSENDQGLLSDVDIKKIASEFFQVQNEKSIETPSTVDTAPSIDDNEIIRSDDLTAKSAVFDEGTWLYKPTDGSPEIEETTIFEKNGNNEEISTLGSGDGILSESSLGDQFTFDVDTKRGELTDENILSEEPLSVDSQELGLDDTQSGKETTLLAPDEEEKRKIIGEFLDKLSKPQDHLVVKKEAYQKKKKFVIFETKYLVIISSVVALNLGVMSYFLIHRYSDNQGTSLSSKERRLFQQDLKQIDQLLVNGDYEVSIKGAVKLASKWYEKAPNYELTRAIYYESKLFLYYFAPFEQKDLIQEIEDFLSEMAKSNGEDPLIVRLQAVYSFCKGDYEKSETFFGKALKFFPTDILLHGYLIFSRIKLGKVESAESAIQTLKKIDDKTYFIPYLNGLILASNQKYQESINEFNDAIKINDKNIEIYYAKADSVVNQWKDEGVAYLNSVSTQYKKYASREQIGVSFLKLGEIARKNSNYLSYIDYLQKGMKYVPYNPEYPYLLGNVYFEMHNYDEAKKFYDVAYKLNDKMWKYVLGKGRSEYINKKYAESIVLLEKSVGASGYSGLVLCTLALVHNALKREDKAIMYLKNSIDKDPQFTESYIELAKLEMARGNKTEAEGYIKKSIELNPNNFIIHYAYANYLIDNMKDDLAEAELLKSISLNNDFALSYNLIGKVYYRRGNHMQALSYYNKALSLSENNPEILINLGLLAKDEKKYDEARTYFDKILEKQNEHPLATRYRGETDVDEGLKQNKETTLLFLQKAAKFDPKDPMTHYNLGRYYEMVNDYDTSLIHYKRARMADLQSSDITLKVARTYFTLKEIPQGIYYANEAFKLDNTNFGALYLLGEIAIKQGEYENAIEFFQKVLLIDSRNSLAQIGLGDCFRNLGQDESAVKSYKQALETLTTKHHESDPQVNITVCETYIKIGQYYDDILALSKSITEYKKAKKLCPTYATAYKQLGFAYKDMKMHKEAISEFRTYLDLEKEPDMDDKTIPKDESEIILKNREEVAEEIENIEEKL